MTAPEVLAEAHDEIAVAVTRLGWSVVRSHGVTTVFRSPGGTCLRLTPAKAHVYADPYVRPGWPVADLGLIPPAAVVAYATEFEAALTIRGNPA